MWAYQWKTSFILDVSKQVKEEISPKKLKNLSVLFNNISVQRNTTPKHIGVYQDEKMGSSTNFASFFKQINVLLKQI